MKVRCLALFLTLAGVALAGCATSYQARPLPIKTPTAYGNAVAVEGALVGAQAYADPQAAWQTFGFDIRGAGMLPVQVVFDNQGPHPLAINPAQTFLEDAEGNLWPILDSQTAYARATKFAETKQIFSQGAYGGFWGAAAGGVLGAAIGIVTGENVAVVAGRGAAAGGAAGATMGGVGGYSQADEARRAISRDLQAKSLQQKPIDPQSLSYGVLFFPGEARSARLLRLQVKAADTGAVHVLMLNL